MNMATRALKMSLAPVTAVSLESLNRPLTPTRKNPMQIEISGFSALMFALIPWALAIAAAAWLVFFDGARILARTMSQEKRAATYVGAKVAPKEPMKIEIKAQPNDRIVIDKVDFDGGDLWVYYRNAGTGRETYIKFAWQQLAPDGTIIKSGDGYPDIYSENDAPSDLDGGQRAEMHLKITTDPRAATLAIRMGC